MTKKILLFSRDPGGANTVAAMVDDLKKNKYDVKLYGKDIALKKYEQFGLEGIDICNEIRQINLDEIKKLILKEKPEFVITGTSADDFTEKYLWKACEEYNIPSFAILDQWVNYGIRFSKYGLSDVKKYVEDKNHSYMPFRILVMDEYSKEQMIKEGIDEDRIFISGQPYFDYLFKKKEKLKSKNTEIVKEEIGIDKTRFLITFASEPISGIYGGIDYLGYTEYSIFCELMSAIFEVNKEINKKITIIIRLHPKEYKDKYVELISHLKDENVVFIIDNKLDIFNLMIASDLICGMSSMFLIESAILGKHIESIQIGLKQENPFILDKKRLVKSIQNTVILKEKIRASIDGVFNNYQFGISFGSIQKVIELMEHYIDI